MAKGYMKPVKLAGGGILGGNVGSFIGGFAGQMNHNIEEQRQQDRQDDLIRFNQFDRTVKEYAKEKKDNDLKSKAYNTILQSTNGNHRLADQLFLQIEGDPKRVGDALNAAQAYNSNPAYAKDPRYAEPEGYQSQWNFGSNLDSQMQRLQGIRSSASPNMQKMMQMPNSDYGTQQPAIPMGGQQHSAPQQQAMPIPSGSQQAAPQPAASPDQLINENTNPALNDQINAAPPSGQPIALDNNQSPPAPNPGMNPVPAAATGTPPLPTGNQPAQSGQLPPLNFGTNASKPITPAEQQRLQQGETRIGIEKQRLDLQKQQKPASPEDAANIDVAKDDAKKYLHDPKTGLQFRYNELANLQRQNIDVGEIQGILERGFKASQVQPAYDELNRFTTGLLGVNLNDLGIQSNSYQDVNLMKKAVANGIINRLSTLHFGRITNFEAGLVQKGFTSSQNDPNTNIQIALALSSSIKSGMEQVMNERKAYRDALNQNPKDYLGAVRGAQIAGEQSADQYYNNNNKTPWAQYKQGVTKDNLGLIASLPPGTWFESKDGMMIRSMGASNGILTLQNAEGVTKTIPTGQ